MTASSEAVLQFWFHDTKPTQWWRADAAFDALIQQQFGDTLRVAAAGGLSPWRRTAHGRLAEIIVLDQFSRNMFRNTPRAFAQDALALVGAREAVQAGALAVLDAPQRGFLLMPFMHSEAMDAQQEGLALFEKHAPDNVESARQHFAIIQRFGRFPHRNGILGRVSTAEEVEFLKQPGSRF